MKKLELEDFVVASFKSATCGVADGHAAYVIVGSKKEHDEWKEKLQAVRESRNLNNFERIK